MTSVMHDVQQCERLYVLLHVAYLMLSLYLQCLFTLFQFEIGKHFMARVLCLIMIPIFVYLFWFAVHFKMLPKT